MEKIVLTIEYNKEPEVREYISCLEYSSVADLKKLFSEAIHRIQSDINADCILKAGDIFIDISDIALSSGVDYKIETLTSWFFRKKEL